MHPLKRHSGIEISDADVAAVTDLYERGQYVQAYQRATSVGPLNEWKGTRARLIASRLAGNVGSQTASRLLTARARLADRENIEAAYFYANDLLYHRGPLAALRFLDRLPEFGQASETQRGNLLSLRARAVSFFRDFESAEKWLSAAEAMQATPSWLLCDRAQVLEIQDAIDLALAAVREALRIRPWYRPAVQMAANYLQMLNRDDEARSLLIESLTHLESTAVAVQLGALELELKLYPEALRSFELASATAPFQDENYRKWLSARISDAYYYAGKFTAARTAALQVEAPFYTEMAERLGQEGLAMCRVDLPVGFVRQSHMTCAPATLSALSRFWKVAVDHEALAAEICYDGTPDHVERHWAENNGFVVREFRVTWESAVALLDRGVPFTLTTTETTNAHLQAVIGYDAIRKTLIIRDPNQRIHAEFPADPLLEKYRAFGPRGLALVPQDRAHLLREVALPETGLYDHLYRVQRALHCHERTEAQNHLDALEREDPEHRLTIFARKRLAAYDGSLARQLAATEQSLAKYPDTPSFEWERIVLLRQQGYRPACRELLHRLAASKAADPVFFREWAQELAEDARQLSLARQHTLRALRFSPTEAENVAQLGRLSLLEGDVKGAVQLYRLAACLRDKIESFSQSFFLAARNLGETEVALRWLERRQERFGKQSSQPTRLLFWALTTLGRTTDALKNLETALKTRPEDGELLLFAADAFGRYGDHARGQVLLENARNRSTPAMWSRTAATVAAYACDLKGSLTLWKELLATEPLALDAQREVTRLTAEVHGRVAALAFLRETIRRFPQHIPTRRLLIEWIRSEDSKVIEESIRQVLSIEPDDAWTRRELAVFLSDQRRFEEAITEGEVALQIEPQNPASHNVRAAVALGAADYPLARKHAREALRISIDFTPAIRTLLDASESMEEKRESLDFVRGELTRQTVFGDGVIAYRDAAFPILEPPELLQHLREALEARPDLWHAWSAVVNQLLEMNALDEAARLSSDAVERFPLVARLWLDAARVHRVRHENEDEAKALRQALRISPAWGLASRMLADSLSRTGNNDEVARVLDQAVAAAPLDPANYGARAALFWRTGRRPEAFAEISKAIRMEPDYEWGWSSLQSWSEEAGETGQIVSLARNLTETRPGKARSWLLLAKILEPNKFEERMAALDRAIELNPLTIETHEVRAQLLAEKGKFEEALHACRPAAFGANPPKELAERAAWILRQQGSGGSAVNQMRELVKRWPDYYRGWLSLTELLIAEGRFSEALEAAGMLTRLAPLSATGHGYVAQAQLELGQTAEAISALRRAFQIDPSYGFAGYNIFNLELDGNEIAAAEKTLQALEAHLPGWRTLACRVRLDSKRGAAEPALAGLKRLCFAPERDSVALEVSATAAVSAGWSKQLEKLVAGCLNQDGANSHVGALWVDRVTSRRWWHGLGRLRSIKPGTPLWSNAYFAYIGAIGSAKKRRRLSSLISREGADLRKDTPCWAQIGFALVSNAMSAKAARWMADWREHTGVQPWMLLNAAIAFRFIGNDSESEAVSRHALTLGRDHTTPLHQLWVAGDSVVAGNYAAAQTLLREIPTKNLRTIYEALYSVIRALLAVITAAEPDRPGVFKTERIVLKQSRFQASFRSKLLNRTARSAVRAMAKAAGKRPFHLGGFSVGNIGGTRLGFRFVWVGVMLASALIRTFVKNPEPSGSGRVVPAPTHHTYMTLPSSVSSEPDPLTTPDFGAAVRLDATPRQLRRLPAQATPRGLSSPKR